MIWDLLTFPFFKLFNIVKDQWCQTKFTGTKTTLILIAGQFHEGADDAESWLRWETNASLDLASCDLAPIFWSTTPNSYRTAQARVRVLHFVQLAISCYTALLLHLQSANRSSITVPHLVLVHSKDESVSRHVILQLYFTVLNRFERFGAAEMESILIITKCAHHNLIIWYNGSICVHPLK